MSRRGRSGPAISLFAFQDIITSVTAIVIVIVLFLALDLVRRKQSDHSDSIVDAVEDVTVRVSELEAEITALKAEVSRAANSLSTVAQFSPAELQAAVERNKQAIQDLHATQRRLEERQRQWLTRKTETLALKFDSQSKTEKIRKFQNESRDLRRQIEQLRDDPRPVFSLPKGFDKSGWLAVVESDVISVAPLGRPAKPISFRQRSLDLLGGTATDAFVKWIQDENLRSDYFLLLVRPEGATQFDNLDRALIRHKIAHGFDVIAAKLQILHPERGAVY
jgi:hypothetical protein